MPLPKCLLNLKSVALMLLMIGLQPVHALEISPYSNLRVDRVEVEGVQSVDRSEVESSVEVSPGEVLERTRVVRTVENLRELYKLHGFDAAKVDAELTQKKFHGTVENILNFRVVEGDPVLLGTVKLVPDWEQSPDSLSVGVKAKDSLWVFWRAREQKWLSQIGLRKGDRRDKDKIQQARRTLQDLLAAEEFVGAQVVDVIESPGALDGSNRPTVDLKIIISLGDRVSFGFRNNSALSRNRLMEIIEDQRLTGFGANYVDTIRKRLVDEYHSVGYYDVKVKEYTFEDRARSEKHVTFEIDEGERAELEAVRFDGNFSFKGAELEEEFFKRAPGITQHRIFVRKEIEKTADLIIEWVRSRGYLSAKLVTVGIERNEQSKKMIAVIYFYEGDQTFVRQLSVSGNQFLSTDEIGQLLGVGREQPLNLFRFSEGLDELKNRYRGSGFLDFKIKNENESTLLTYSKEARDASIVIACEEGPRYRVSEIFIDGLTFTREEVVRRELRFDKDDVVEEQKIQETELALNKLGIFSTVAVRPVEDLAKPGYKKIHVTIQEGTPGILEGRLGLRNDLGVRALGQVGYTNLFRKNHTLSLTGNVNRRFDEDFCATVREKIDNPGANYCFIEYQMQLGYLWPWFVAGETSFRPRFTVEKTQFKNFDLSSIGLAASLERTLWKSMGLFGSLTYSIERNIVVHSEDDADNGDLRIGTVTPAFRIDQRDDSLAPTKGYFISGSFDWASPYFLSQSKPFPIGYTRFQARADRFQPLGRAVTWYSSVRIGVERNNQTTSKDDPNYRYYAIPVSKQFSLGGIGSLRGYGEQELYVKQYFISGTLSYVNYRFQVDFPFAGPMRFGPFIDGANLLVDRFSLVNDLNWGAGFGFHYQSPVGPVNFDFGFKLKPEAGDPNPYRFYFSIGVI